MRRLALLVLALALAATSAAAQGTPTRRPPRDTIRIAEPARPAVDEDSIAVEETESDTVAGDSVPRPGPFSQDGGRGPFSVEASGQVAPRPSRGEVVWLKTAAPRVASADTASGRDTARTGSGRTASTGTSARDTASTRRTGSATAPRTGQTARRDTAAAPSRTATRDTASTRRAGTGQTARRDTASTRRTGTGQTARRDTAANRTAQGSTPAARARTHTVAAGETFFGIARRYGVTAAQLRAINPDVDWESVETGDVLRLPANARDSRAGQGTSGQTQNRAGSQTPRTGSQPSRPAARTHTVQPGETLFGIARRYGVTRQAIIDANDLESDQVRTGQRLTIPPPD